MAAEGFSKGAEGSVLLIQFAKEPVPGQVKTRLVPHLSENEAAALHSELVLWTANALLNAQIGPVQLSVTGAGDHPVFQACIAAGVSDVVQQRGDDLGQRMYHALSVGLQRYAKVILVGSDCPGIDPAYLHAASVALDSAPVVLGPAHDGGYVLIGASQIDASLFQQIPWGTAQVFETTTAALLESDIKWRELSTQADIDRPEDLPIWHAIKTQSQMPAS